MQQSPAPEPTSSPRTTSNGLARRLFLIPTVILILIALSVVVFLLTHSSQKFESRLNNFANGYTQTRYMELINQAGNEKDQSKSKDDLILAYGNLVSDYQVLPAEDKHNELVSLSNYILKKFPDQSSNPLLTVPCKEESCGAVKMYSDELLQINKSIDELKLEDQSQVVLRSNVDSVALVLSTGDKTKEFAAWNGLFNALRSEYDAKKSSELKSLLDRVLKDMQDTDSDTFKVMGRYGAYKVE